MNPKRLIPREEWEAALKAEGCRPCEKAERYIKSGELWMTDFGQIFPVPVEDVEGRMLFEEQVQTAITLVRIRQKWNRTNH